MSDNKKMHICFIMFRCYPLFNENINATFGGSEVELYNMATYFADLDNVKVDFIVGDYGQNDIEKYGNITLIKAKYMKLDEFKSFKDKILRYFYFFRVLLKQDSQIYITKTASEVLGWMVIFLKYLKKKKVVFRLGSDKDAEMEFWKKSGKKLYYLYKFGLKHCDIIYAQSNIQKNMLKQSYAIDSLVLKNVFHLRDEKAKDNKDYILWVSRCEPLKRPLIFIEMAKRIPEEKFLIIMPHGQRAEKSQNHQIESIIADVKKAAGELKNLEYLEFVPYNRIQTFYNRAKLFVNTSEYEGFPNSFIQSCMGSTGILSLRVNPDGFITKHELGFHCDDSIDKAVKFIRGLSSEDIKRMGENAYNYVMQNHEVSKICSRYVEDFNKLMSSDFASKGDIYYEKT